MSKLDTVIFGDNQFFGINHHSEEKARELAERFGKLEAITRVYEDAWEVAIRGFMLNANHRADSICDYLRANGPDDMALYPSIPYPHKYANAVNEKGLFGAIRDFTEDDGLFSFAKRGAEALLSQDMVPVMKTLVDLEMQTFRNMNVKVLFLQNILTDLLLGVGAEDVLAAFGDHVKTRWGVEPGFLSMNMPMAVRVLRKAGIDDPIVCSAINRAGYFMNPSIEAVEATLQAGQFRPMAMSIMASGAVPPAEAISYVAGLPLKSVVFGASSRRNIEQTANLLWEGLGR